MPTTDYIVANGMMLGEATNGVMRNYGTDALGSVVQTYSNGVPENTYAYKPYGATLTKTEAAADPSFLWNGGSGYRATTLAGSDYYVRSRHFALGLAHWTSVDLNWPGQPAYQYAGSSPIERADPSGLSTCQVNYFGMSAAKAQCSGSIKGGVLWLKAYKTVYFECAAQCSGGMSSCFLDQQYSLVETLAVVGQLPVVRYDTGGFVQDGPVQYPYPYSSMQGNWQAQSWTLIGMDSPGYWAYQNPEASPCNVGPQTPYNSGIPSDQNKMSFLWFTGHFETVCQCDQLVMPDDNLKSKLYWHFTFSVAWIGTDVSNVITLGGDCA